MPRRRPYTAIGIRRLPCHRAGCPNRARQQWQVCADGNVWRPICDDCDAELNRIVLEWVGDPEAAAKVARYRAARTGE